MFVVRRRIASLASRGKPVSPVGPLLVTRSRQTESLLRGTSSAPRRRRLTVTLFHHPERCPSGLRSATSRIAALASRGKPVSPVGPLLVAVLTAGRATAARNKFRSATAATDGYAVSPPGEVSERSKERDWKSRRC